MTVNLKPNFEQIYLHYSQFPDQVYHDYLTGFKQKNIPHKFHYDSVKQSQKWLKIHEVFSPARNNQDCIISYEQCFKKTASIINNQSSIELIGLGCGGGAKDQLLISALVDHKNQNIAYYPIDVSSALAVISAQKIRASFPQVSVKPVVCDLLYADNLIQELNSVQNSQKILTFFGMIPNFTPDQILPILSNFLNSGDLLLISANLAPGNDYLAGIEKVKPQYDNDLTKDWLITILTDAGISENDGEIIFTLKNDLKRENLTRINAHFELTKDVTFPLESETITWQKNEQIQLFFSYRYTTEKVKTILQDYQINVVEYWEAPNQEEAIYLCQKL